MVSQAGVLNESIITIVGALITDSAFYRFVYEEHFHKDNKKYALTSTIVLMSKIAHDNMGN